jgi:flagellar hook protein FlgE
MAIWGSLTTAAMAMNSHSHRMGQISANIANMNTTSYKEVETNYKTQMSNSWGGNDFFSVKPVDTRRVSVQGTVSSTGNAYDMAINGRGFFVTNSQPDGSGDKVYTRDGTFGTLSSSTSVDTDGDGQNDQVSYLTSKTGNYVMGWAADGAGGFSTALSAVQVNHNSVVPAKATSSIYLSGNVPNNNGVAASYNTALPIVATNADGTSSSINNLGLNWSKTIDDQNTWTLNVSGSANVATVSITPATATFTDLGKFDVNSGSGIYTVDVTWVDGSEPSTITLDMTDMNQYASTDGFTVGKIVADGYQEGRLDHTGFNEFGVLSGYYSNGKVQDIYKLPLANFTAPDNLQALSGNDYRESADSGSPTLESIDSRTGIGIFVPNALENSNVNLEDQFSRMIVTQKAYSMASTAFRTNDEMLQEVRNLKR